MIVKNSKSTWKPVMAILDFSWLRNFAMTDWPEYSVAVRGQSRWAKSWCFRAAPSPPSSRRTGGSPGCRWSPAGPVWTAGSQKWARYWHGCRSSSSSELRLVSVFGCMMGKSWCWAWETATSPELLPPPQVLQLLLSQSPERGLSAPVVGGHQQLSLGTQSLPPSLDI